MKSRSILRCLLKGVKEEWLGLRYSLSLLLFLPSYRHPLYCTHFITHRTQNLFHYTHCILLLDIFDSGNCWPWWVKRRVGMSRNWMLIQWAHFVSADWSCSAKCECQSWSSTEIWYGVLAWLWYFWLKSQRILFFLFVTPFKCGWFTFMISQITLSLLYFYFMHDRPFLHDRPFY